MSQAKKIALYELNPRFFKDYSGNGIGDLQGLASKFDYFKFLGVDGVILQDILSTDSQDKIQNFQTVSSEIGNMNDLVKVLSIAKKNGTQVLIELNIGSIKENHKWFENAIVEQTGEFENIIKVSERKEMDLVAEDNIKYKYASEQKSYYLVDSKTQEIPLNWKSEQVMEQFLKVIRFWRDLGISGFVLKNFEYLADIERKNIMSDATLKELRKFYRAIKNVEDNIIIIGKSDVIEIEDASQYTNGITQVLDYFMSTKISMLGTKDEDSDYIGKFKIKKLINDIKKIGMDASNIIAFGSSRVGRIVSRWANDNQYHQESSKALSMLLHLSNASSSIYYGDEIGAKNIGLTHLDDFQDATLLKRKKEKVSNANSEMEFMDAQVLQNPINARSLMAWNDQKNGGFSNAEKTITPVSTTYRLVNVETEFEDSRSILNFNKQLIKIATDSTYAPIIASGKFKITSFIPGVVKIIIRHNNKEIIALINMSNGNRPIISKFLTGKVILSTYAYKEYKTLPTILEAYEGIIISKHTDEFVREKEAEKIANKKADELRQVAEFEARAKAQAEKDRIIREEIEAKEAAKKAEEEAKLKAEKEIQLAKEIEAKAAEKAKTQEIKLAQIAAKEAERARTLELKQAELEAKAAEKAKTQEIKLAQIAAKEAEKAQTLELKQAELEVEEVRTQEITLNEVTESQEEILPQKEETVELIAPTQEIEEVKIEENILPEQNVIAQEEIALDSIAEQKEFQRIQQQALMAAAKNSGETTQLTEEQIAKTTQVNIDTENIDDFIAKLNRKEK